MIGQTTSRRHVFGAAALGALLTLTPIVVVSSTSSAKAPAVAVTGLSRGARGDSVRTVQQALVNQGVSVRGGVDGIFGPGTESAVKSFQKAQGLTATGVVDAATAIALGLASSPFLGLAQGVRGDAVKQLQQRLDTAGFTPAGGADGIFGPGTKAALVEFQAAKGLEPTGVVNAATAAALAEVSAEGSGSETAPTAEPAADPAPTSSLVGLKIGSRGDAVVTLQKTIMHAGFTVVGGADGIFGVLTANALRSFQNANGLPVTGVVDEATSGVLQQVGTGDGSSETHDPTVSSSPLLGLRYGSIGSDVVALQQTLIDAGIHVRGGADGVFGTATQSALKQYQQAKGLPQSGTVDEATATALAAADGASTTAAASALVGLKAGALGNTVIQLQQALIDAGVHVRGGADGIFGPATSGALKEFQTSQGLESSGVVDEATAAALADPKPAAVKSAEAGEGGYPVYGEKGTRVLALQSALVKAGIALRGGVDGDFGGGTSAAVMEFQRQNGLGVTGKVNDATAQALGLAKLPAPITPDPTTVHLEVFPVQGRCSFGDSWGYPRSGGRVHLGVDIIAAEGHLLYAVSDGKVEKIYTDYPGSLAGNGVRLRMADGTYFFYAHMSALADGIDVGVPVKAGQIVGYVGSTGDAGTPHLHFEVHPQGGSAVNPYPLVKAIDACNVTDPLPQP